MKVFLAAGAIHYVCWFPFKVELVEQLEDAELIVFEGGEDVSPQLYDDKEHPLTYSNIDRDLREVNIFEKALNLNIPMLGICRGSQFLCVMSGGKLVQDQPNPGAHMMKYRDDNKAVGYNEILVTSTHHQAQFPYNLSEDEYKIIGWTNNLSGHHEDGDQKEMHPEKECEVVYYPKTKCLGIQPHPEMMYDYNRFTQSVKPVYKDSVAWFQNLLIDFLDEKL